MTETTRPPLAADPAGTARDPGTGFALGVLALVFGWLLLGFVVFDADLSVIALGALGLVIPCALRLGHRYSTVERFAYDGVRRAFDAIMIMLAVGVLLGAWMASGTVATLTYYGLDVLTPQTFLPVALLVAVVVSLATGSSWGAIGTIGVALITVAQGFDVPLGIAAGAILSGVFFGDKMSPISETTVLAPAVAGSKLIPHVVHMMWSTVPALAIALVAYVVLGLGLDSRAADTGEVDVLRSGLADTFSLGVVPLLPAVLVVVLLVMRKPPFVAILLGAVAGALVGWLQQGFTVAELLDFAYSGFVPPETLGPSAELITGGGILGIFGVVALMIFVLAMGGILTSSGMVDAALRPVVGRLIRGPRSLGVGALAISFASSAVAASVNFAMAITGPLLAPVYRRYGLAPKNLSRAMEDAATMGGQIIPWNVSVVFAATTLGVHQLDFIPYTFVCILVPFISLAYAVTGFTIVRLEDDPDGVLDEPGETGAAPARA